MKAIILAGGQGTRLSEETVTKPKPMVEIGGMPIIWHIMKIYSSHGINEFVICCGYKGYIIKEYFANYFLHSSDITVDIKANSIDVHEKRGEPWKITLIDTGEKTNTGGRLLRVARYIEKDSVFCFTYGDGLSDVDINDLIKFHKAHKKIATLTATVPVGRYGSISIEGDFVKEFREKAQKDSPLINGGFFVFSPKILDFIENDNTILEQDVLPRLTDAGELMAYRHNGFWQAMDTLRDKEKLNQLWNNKNAVWKKWD